MFIEHTEETCSDKAAFVYLGGEVTAFYSSIIKLFMGSAGWACLVISFQWKKSNGKININRKQDFLYPDFDCFAIQKYLRTESHWVRAKVSMSTIMFLAVASNSWLRKKTIIKDIALENYPVLKYL